MTLGLDAAHSIVNLSGVPNGWQDVRVDDLATIVGGGTPDREDLSFWRNGTVPWITPTDLTANPGKYISRGAESISEDALRRSNATLVPRGSIVFSTRGTVGKMAIAANPLTSNQSCENLVPRDRAVDGEFLYYLLNFGIAAFLRLSGGTTFGAITRRDIARVHFAVPKGSDEQAAIARILDAVDTAIERTRVAVERAKEARRGLLQSVFEFRGTREVMKNTDAGRIPSSWKAVKGKQAFVVVTGGCSSVEAVRRLREGEQPDSWFMKVDDFNDPENHRMITRTKIGFVAANNPDFKVLPLGTVVIAKRGAAILKNRVRVTTVPIALDPNLMALHTLPGVGAEFLMYQLEWRNLSRYVESSGVPQLNNKDLYPRWFLRAPDVRQEEIVTLIRTADRREDTLFAKCEALEVLKRSLMHDLLTGRVRVGGVAG